METNTILNGYLDNYLLSSYDTKDYNIESTYNKVLAKLKELKLARSKFVDGYHLRITQNYLPKLEMKTNSKSDYVGNFVESLLDSIDIYNEFNKELYKLYNVISKVEVAYINDCLIGNDSQISFMERFNLTRTEFRKVKTSSIVRLGLAFNIIVYN